MRGLEMMVKIVSDHISITSCKLIVLILQIEMLRVVSELCLTCVLETSESQASCHRHPNLNTLLAITEVTRIAR